MIEITEIVDTMKYIDGLSAVVFDLDDTLYSEKQYVRSGYHAVASAISQLKDMEAKLWDEFEVGNPAIDIVLKEEGIYTEELKNFCLSIYRTHKPNISLYGGVTDMLKELHRRGVNVGIITDGRPEGQKAKIEALGLESMVDAIIITDDLGGVEYRKPCDIAFRLMKERIGDGRYSTMCYVGDNIKKDFIAPEKLGMKVIWFKNKEGLYVSEQNKKYKRKAYEYK